MSSVPFMKFYISDYLVDTQHLTTLEHGAYMLLLMTYFQSGKSLPNNDKKLSQFCKLSEAKFKKMKTVLSEFFFISEHEWIHKRVEKELDEMAKKSGTARLSAMVRWSKSIEENASQVDANAMRTQCERNANAMLTDKNRTEQNREEKKTPKPPIPVSQEIGSPSARRKYVEKNSDVIFIFDRWKNVMRHPDSRIDKKRSNAILNAIDMGYRISEIEEAIIGCSKNPWNMGLNPNGKIYDDICLILRDASHIDSFIADFKRPPIPPQVKLNNVQHNQLVLEEFYRDVEREVIESQNLLEGNLNDFNG